MGEWSSVNGFELTDENLRGLVERPGWRHPWNTLIPALAKEIIELRAKVAELSTEVAEWREKT